jgi:hypothetical protein
MAITLLYGCCQIELSVRDLDAACGFMEGTLGGGKIEQELARQIAELMPDVGYRIDHLDCGEGMFQINQPSPAMLYRGQKSVHQAYLDSIGPCVSNLNYFIDDHVHARELLAALGAATRIEGPSSAARCLADYAPDNTRPGGDERPFLFMGTRHLIGLDLELMEPNFLRFTDQTVQYPCFVQPRPKTGDGNLKLLRLRLVVPDLDETYGNLVRLFTPGSRSKPYAIREDSAGKAFRVGLAGIELEYVQPASDRSELAQQLERYGPGVVSIHFGARDRDTVLARAGNLVRSVDDLCYNLASRDIVGFDVVLEPISSRILA